MANPAHVPNSFLGSITRIVLAVEEWFTAFIILMSTSAFIDLYSDAGYEWVPRLNYYMWKLIVIAALCFMVLRWQRVLPQLMNGKFLLAFIGILWISQYWSIASNETKTSATLVIESTLIGIYIATRYSFKEQTKLFTLVFGLISLLSIFYVFALPNLGKMYGAGVSGDLIGTWRGIYRHKNILGRVITVGAIFLLIAPLNNYKNKIINWLIFFISFQLLIGTDSKTALVGFLFIISISPIARVFRWNPSVGIPLYLSTMILGGVGAVFLGDNWDSALASIDKDPTLNGRLPIWEIMMDRIQERPWLGYGYGAFWQGWKGKYSAPIWRTIVWKPGHAHNGFIDLLVELGIIGTLIFAMAFFDAILKSINRIRYTQSFDSMWPLGFMTFYVLMNQTQTALISPYNIQWLLFVVICFTSINREQNDIPGSPRGSPLSEGTEVSSWEPICGQKIRSNTNVD
ncbi:MAG: O-antigen ligase family protein [Planktothrix sp.]